METTTARRSRQSQQNHSSGRRRAVILNEEQVILELHLNGFTTHIGNLWYLDNGASNHMIGDLGKFKNLHRGITEKVRFGDRMVLLLKYGEGISFVSV